MLLGNGHNSRKCRRAGRSDVWFGVRLKAQHEARFSSTDSSWASALNVALVHFRGRHSNGGRSSIEIQAAWETWQSHHQYSVIHIQSFSWFCPWWWCCTSNRAGVSVKSFSESTAASLTQLVERYKPFFCGCTLLTAVINTNAAASARLTVPFQIDFVEASTPCTVLPVFKRPLSYRSPRYTM